MTTLESCEAWYPCFHLGHRPQAVKCELRIVEANGRRYFKTPFAMLNAYGDDIAFALSGGIGNVGYFRTEAECDAYLAGQYPHWEAAAPLMLALFNAREDHGEIVGTYRIADKLCVDLTELYQLARGERRFTLRKIRSAVKAVLA